MIVLTLFSLRVSLAHKYWNIIGWAYTWMCPKS